MSGIDLNGVLGGKWNNLTVQDVIRPVVRLTGRTY